MEPRTGEQADSARPDGVAERLRAGEQVDDCEFDSLYASDLQQLSAQHWTPVRVASRAARLLTDIGATRILDIGSGPGKFCIVGSLTTSAHFTGIDKRRKLVATARMAAQQLGADGAHFLCANVLDFDFGPFDGIYLYNPFYEQVAADLRPIEDPIEFSPELFEAYVICTTAKLALASVGTAVVTYHGFGGVMSSAYHCVDREDIGSDELVLWVKRR